ncbi:LytR/AlgR family response regulator transcription factor [Rouxiella badensis]|uniref:DNA-binding response regulator n=1 Tax=Rouxiella badensis TaxID=1646377 RepID=A0A1X0WCJ3_9GAMM|nr:LytTR family DNA-binding domain-containing protein [Rouxiella badensis]MCC3703037.1 LytTR family DNA-binding domain-containing protein [Rouxiella badensis]MCC3721221.1 LytTR family DNA-binding domain-containing protein [Rouxiella badensis]MCC3730884.1 LytTR family DNA-binding domain-containing protein [Rouxiella badensis]MCC3734556.1 LytTR family DNA-binding domain-containing protein [Rouxiella badensis]MCC3742459.1 LytTR family DNA-binding domain-containing protein [Rouxiella badensis]
MKAIIVEDEFLAQEELSYLIKTHSGIEIVDKFDDGLEVLKYLQNHQVDAIFLDINIPSLDGVLLAQNISKFAHKPYIIFITAYKEHAAEAFEIEAFDYILKPYHESRIVTMLQKLETHFKRDRQADTPAATGSNRVSHSINLIKDERIIVTDINDIYYAAAQEKVTQVYTRREEFTMPMNISELCNRLPAEHFFRCHRSYCVNLSKIREIVPWFNNTYILRLSDLDFEVPVSRSRVKAFRQLMGL